MANKKQELKIIKPASGAIAVAQKATGLLITEEASPEITPTPLPVKKSRKTATDPIITSGIGAKQSTFAKIDEIAAKEGFTANAIKRFALEYFIRQYEEGQAKADLNSRRVKADKLT